jgi:thiamine biosynthesis lipoprotein
MVCGAVLLVITACSGEKYTHIAGFAQGTTYSIIYSSAVDYSTEIDSILRVFEHSLSIYIDSSIVSKVNKNEETDLDSFFVECFGMAKYVYNATDGAFDVSAMPLFELWGFGRNKEHTIPTQKHIDSVKEFCGMDKIDIIDGILYKKDMRVQLNFNAIAKGYSVDVISRFLDGKNVVNYMVEIGGEVFCRGVNDKKRVWNIGIDAPFDGNYAAGQTLQAAVELDGMAIATSGNYRRFFSIDGRKYSHTIDPRSGKSVSHNMLSASIIAKNCAMADAYATYCMVVGLDSAKIFVERMENVKACLIYEDSNGKMQVWRK